MRPNRSLPLCGLVISPWITDPLHECHVLELRIWMNECDHSFQWKTEKRLARVSLLFTRPYRDTCLHEHEHKLLEKLRMPKPNTKAITLDAVTERRTKRYSPTFWAQRWLLWANFHIPVSRQRGRELSPPRPCVRDPFHPLSFSHSYYEFLYIYIYMLAC